MRRILASAIAAALILGSGATAQFADEATFNTAQAKKLNGWAKNAFKKGFPRRAKIVWLMVLSEYDTDNLEAHTALGHAKVGNSWAPRSDFKYPTEDAPNASAAKSLKSSWAKLAKQLGGAHRAKAQDYAKAGRMDRSRYHFEKTIRYLPTDKAAQTALDHKPVESLSGTDLERTLYDRSKLIDKSIAAQHKVDYQVEELPASDTSAILDQAQVQHKSVRSEHFIFRGDFDLENLINSAKYGERAIRVAAEIFDGYDGFFTDVSSWPVSEVIFVASKETFQQVLQANTDKFIGDQKDYEWTYEHSSSASLRPNITLVSAGDEKVMYDSAVRRVARMSAGVRTTAMVEGIGHTMVGNFFNNNRLFQIDRQRQVETSTEDEIEYNSPNFDEWKDLAIENAWKKGGTPAAELPLFQAHDFPNDGRIKAWSFCDYLVRRDPKLVKELDRLNRAAGLHNAIDIAEQFKKNNDGLTIAQLEKEWRDFWTEASPVLKAIRNNTPPLEAVSKDVKKWLEAFNKARQEYAGSTVTWSSDYSSRCAEHARYLIANKKQRGAGAEHSQDAELEGGTHLGNMFAQMALVETKAKKPKDVFKQWMMYPGYRDALMNSFLWTVGIYAEKGILVMEVLRGVRSKSKREGGGFTCYPRGQRGVGTEVAVSELGPELEKLLADNGRAGQKVVGLPLSFHGFGSRLPGDRNSYQCQVKQAGGDTVKGVLHVGASGGTNRHTSAPGMAVFYPFEPLKKGAKYHVQWSFSRKGTIEKLSAQFDT